MSNDKIVNINGVNYSCIHRIENDNNIEKIISNVKGFDAKTNQQVFLMTRIISHVIDSEPSDFEEHTYIISQDDDDLITSTSEVFDGSAKESILSDFFRKLLTTINTFSR